MNRRNFLKLGGISLIYIPFLSSFTRLLKWIIKQNKPPIGTHSIKADGRSYIYTKDGWSSILEDVLFRSPPLFTNLMKGKGLMNGGEKIRIPLEYEN